MSRRVLTDKWQRVTTTKAKRKKSRTWIPYGQLYREIAAGYDHYLAARIRTEALQHATK